MTTSSLESDRKGPPPRIKTADVVLSREFDGTLSTVCRNLDPPDSSHLLCCFGASAIDICHVQLSIVGSASSFG